MKVADAVAKALKAEGVEYLFAYPVNPLIEAAAKVDIRPIIVRQERIGLHMADAMSRVSSGEKIGVFCMQSGPGSENAFGGVAQAFGDSAPIVVLPMGYARQTAQIQPNFSSALNYRHVTKSCEQVTVPEAVPEAMRRAFTPGAQWQTAPRPRRIPPPISSMRRSPTPTIRRRRLPCATVPTARRSQRRPRPCSRPTARSFMQGQGLHYAKAWDSLKELAELLGAAVTTSLGGKSAFPRRSSPGAGLGRTGDPEAGASFLTESRFDFWHRLQLHAHRLRGRYPAGQARHSRDPGIRPISTKTCQSRLALVGDAGLILDGLVEAVRARSTGASAARLAAVAEEIGALKAEWLEQWMPKLACAEAPISPYRVIWDLLHTVDVKNTIITHDAGSPRDQLSPFWQSVAPLSYIGWGKTTQLGYGLGLAMGAKLAKPDALCINVWGDAAIGFTGMDFETAVRERIPILSLLFNNFSMAIEIPIMPVSTEKFGSTNISGHYADMAKAFGGYGERVESPDQIIPAIQRGIAKTEAGSPALLEFITAKETAISVY